MHWQAVIFAHRANIAQLRLRRLGRVRMDAGSRRVQIQLDRVELSLFQHEKQLFKRNVCRHELDVQGLFHGNAPAYQSSAQPHCLRVLSISEPTVSVNPTVKIYLPAQSAQTKHPNRLYQ